MAALQLHPCRCTIYVLYQKPQMSIDVKHVLHVELLDYMKGRLVRVPKKRESKIVIIGVIFVLQC